MNRYPLILVCGDTADGKTAIVNAAVERLGGLLTPIPTTTSRPARPEEAMGTPWYHFASRTEAQHIIDQGLAVNWAAFNGHLYISSRQEVDQVLSRSCGVQIVVEPSVDIFRNAGYWVVTIHITSIDAPPNKRAEERAEEDRARRYSIPYDFEFTNRFDPGGPGANFQATVDRFSDLIRRYQ